MKQIEISFRHVIWSEAFQMGGTGGDELIAILFIQKHSLESGRQCCGVSVWKEKAAGAHGIREATTRRGYEGAPRGDAFQCNDTERFVPDRGNHHHFVPGYLT